MIKNDFQRSKNASWTLEKVMKVSAFSPHLLWNPNNFDEQESSFKKLEQFDSNRKSNQSEDVKERDNSNK